jgi:hypothetical protein
MSATPKKYRFDMPVPTFEPRPLPVRRPDASVVQSTIQAPDQAFCAPAQEVPAQPAQVIHIHEAAQPDKTLQKMAFGAGFGAGSVPAAVYFGPLLTASLTVMAIIVLAGGLAIAVLAVSIVHVVGALKPEQAKGKRRR